MDKKVILWDFDGTLGYRHGGMWSRALWEAIRLFDPDAPVTIEKLVPFLQSGFPWHHPNLPHTHLKDADLWWENLQSKVFEPAFLSLGYSDAQAKDLAKLFAPQIRRCFLLVAFRRCFTRHGGPFR